MENYLEISSKSYKLSTFCIASTTIDGKPEFISEKIIFRKKNVRRNFFFWVVGSCYWKDHQITREDIMMSKAHPKNRCTNINDLFTSLPFKTLGFFAFLGQLTTKTGVYASTQYCGAGSKKGLSSIETRECQISISYLFSFFLCHIPHLNVIKKLKELRNFCMNPWTYFAMHTYLPMMQ